MAIADVVTITQSFRIVDCCDCGMIFAVPCDIDQRWREDGTPFYCPSGHRQHYSTSEIQRLQKQLEDEKRSREFHTRRADQLKDQVRYVSNQLRGEKAAKTRIKNRIGSGVCPCCNRTFKQLAAHMESQHPEFKKGD